MDTEFGRSTVGPMESPATRRAEPDRGSLPAMAARPKALDLKTIWLFSSCTGSELRKIRSSLDEIEVPKGKVLVEEGRIGLEFFLIVTGKAAVSRNGKRVATLGPGDHFGELALLDRRPRSATVTSETDMDVLVLSQRQFNGLLQSVPTIARKMLAAMANRLREADAKAYD
jgi:CRP/FNR family transcriptional regulator, cyclic AMP receptor protein